MTIQEAINYLGKLKVQVQDKKTAISCQSFSSLLDDLQSKDLTKADLRTINKKLSELDITADSPNKNKQLKKAKGLFLAFLHKTFAYSTKDYYTSLYMGLGISFGLSLGIGVGVSFGMPKGLVFGMMIGMALGMGIGLVLGNMKDTIAEREGRILRF
jgi:hypothetical protein